VNVAGAVSAGPDNVLEVDKLSVGFRNGSGYVAALRDVSFNIKPGEIFGLVGESGCGKSTTIRSIIGLLPAGASVLGGSVRLSGEELLTLPPGALRLRRGRQIGMVFQNPLSALNPLIPIARQIAEAIACHDSLSSAELRKRVIAAMRMVHLPDPERLAALYPHQLSGGQRQRVALAIALSLSPRLLLADEPTTALDVTVQHQILQLLKTLRDETGASVILVTHDLGVVAQTCQRLAVMYAGRIVETGSVESVFAAPRHPYTRGLLGALPQYFPRGTPLAVIPGQPPRPGAIERGCPFLPRCQYAGPECAADIPILPAGDRHVSACIREGEVAGHA
jgi:oligopeptide/dipeptide ABC transporter ATP-binding protein